MKWVVVCLALATVAVFSGGWLTNRYGGQDAKTNMDSLPLTVAGFVLFIATCCFATLWVLVTLWRAS